MPLIGTASCIIGETEEPLMTAFLPLMNGKISG